MYSICNPCQANQVKKQCSRLVLLIGPYLDIADSFWKFALGLHMVLKQINSI
jgi:hypothetical protein